MKSMKLKPSISEPLLKIGAALAGGILLFVLVIGIATTSFRTIYSGRIFPNIQIGWINLSGQAPIDAADLLKREIQYPEQGEITLQYDDLSWTATPAELGLFFSPQFNAELAFNTGREGNFARRIAAQIQILRHGMILAPQFVMDEKTGSEYLAGLAAEVNQPVMEASLELDGLEVVVQPGQIGREMDIQASLEVVGLQMQSMQDGSIPLIVTETYPVILDVTAQAEFARQILSQPLLLQIPDAADNDPGPWSIQPDKLVEMMIIERIDTDNGSEYRIALDSEALREYLVGREGTINKSPKSARMYFDDETKELVLIEEDITGLVLDINQSIIDTQAQLLEGTHTIDLAVEKTFPPVTSEHTAEELGITELVRSETSYFSGSDSSRINNIATAAAKFHGIFIAPGETFSMAEQLGDVSLDEGYSEALFRTVFFGGYQVVERHPHAYRVLYYEQNPNGSNNPKLAGLDATVYVPIVDFKFTNDSDHWLLMETYVPAGYRQLLWKFYSTSDGRTVNWSTTGLENKKDPPDPIYEENSDLAKGEIKQVDWAVDGATVTIRRDVFRDGQKLWQDIFKTKYQPWAAICQYGPDTGNYPPENPDPDDPCKRN